MFLYGYKVMTPQANKPIFEYQWSPEVRTIVKVRVGTWVDPMHEMVSDGKIIEDKVNKVFYMSIRSFHELRKELRAETMMYSGSFL